jgi:hypothetical protein
VTWRTVAHQGGSNGGGKVRQVIGVGSGDVLQERRNEGGRGAT